MQETKVIAGTGNLLKVGPLKTSKNGNKFRWVEINCLTGDFKGLQKFIDWEDQSGKFHCWLEVATDNIQWLAEQKGDFINLKYCGKKKDKTLEEF